MIQGKTANVLIQPTVITSSTKTKAVIGVPNKAENTAAIPAKIMPFTIDLGSFKRYAILLAILPPSCKAAPSLPEEPPPRWVRTVPIKIVGAMAMGNLSPFSAATKMPSVPLSPGLNFAYINAITAPKTGSVYNTHGFSPLNSVTKSTAR